MTTVSLAIFALTDDAQEIVATEHGTVAWRGSIADFNALWEGGQIPTSLWNCTWTYKDLACSANKLWDLINN